MKNQEPPRKNQQNTQITLIHQCLIGCMFEPVCLCVGTPGSLLAPNKETLKKQQKPWLGVKSQGTTMPTNTIRKTPFLEREKGAEHEKLGPLEKTRKYHNDTNTAVYECVHV